MRRDFPKEPLTFHFDGACRQLRIRTKYWHDLISCLFVIPAGRGGNRADLKPIWISLIPESLPALLITQQLSGVMKQPVPWFAPRHASISPKNWKSPGISGNRGKFEFSRRLFVAARSYFKWNNWAEASGLAGREIDANYGGGGKRVFDGENDWGSVPQGIWKLLLEFSRFIRNVWLQCSFRNRLTILL